MYRFLLSRRWIGLAVFAIALSALCIRLGVWQWHRMDYKKQLQELIGVHLATDPVPLTSVLQPGRPVTDEAQWTRVRVSGTFDAAHQVTVKFTTRAGAPGADVVAPLLLDNGWAVLVDRGWMPTANDAERPSDVPRPPRGRVSIEGWLRPDNGAGSHAVIPDDRQVRAISSRGMRDFVGKPLLPGFINQQDPPASGLTREPRPSVSHALNFFYALQWWFFAGLALLGYAWFARDELRGRRTAAQASATRSA